MSEERPISFQGQLTEREFTRIQRASLPRFLAAFLWFLLTCLVLVLLTGDLSQFLTKPADQVPRLALFLFIMIFSFVGPARAIRKAWRSNAAVRAPISGVLSAEGISWQGAFNQGSYPWEALHGYRHRGDILLLYSATTQAFFLLPRFFASPGAWQEALATVASRLKKR